MDERDKRTLRIAAMVIAGLILCGLCGICGVTGVSVFLINQLERDRPIYDDSYDQGLPLPDEDEGFVPGHYLTEVGFGESFEIDGLEITFIDEVMFEGRDRTILYVPIEVRNLADSPIDLGTIGFTQTGPDRSYLDGDSLKMDASFARAGVVAPGQTLPTFFAFSNEGDGTYTVEFTHTVSPTGTMETIRVLLPIAR